MPKYMNWRNFWIFWLGGLAVFLFNVLTSGPLMTDIAPTGILDHQSAGTAERVNAIQQSWAAAGQMNYAKWSMIILSFRNIWRFNAIVIASIPLIGIAALFLFVVEFMSYHPDYRGSGSVSSQESAVEDEKVRLAFSEWVDLPGTTLAAMKFGVTYHLQSYEGSFGSGSKYRSDTIEERNIILLNREDGSFRHIVPDNDRKLLNWYILKAGDGKDQKDSKAIGYVAQFASRSHTENSTEIVKTDILLGNFLTGKQKWIMTEVEALDYPKLVETDAATMIVWSEGKARFLRIGLDDLEIKIDHEISMIPNSS